ncbi:hypothetical protein D3C71_1782340 [compost metagenome]
MQLLRDLFLHLREQVRRDGAVGDINFTTAEAVNVTDLGGDRQERRLIDHRFLVVPIARAAFKHDTLIHHPLFQAIGSIADIVRR